MKKLLLIIIFVFTHNLYATNCVPIISNVETDENKKAIFTVITTNSFVSALNPENFEKLSPEDKEAIIEDEEAFLKKKIQKTVPSAEVLFIPKSLYELFVYCFGHKQKQEAIERILSKCRANKVIDGKETESDWQTCARWTTEAKEGNSGIGFLECEDDMEESVPDIYSKIDNYYANPHVQAAFWEINEKILSVLKRKEIHRIDETALKSLTYTVIDDIDDILTRESISYIKFEEWRENFDPEKPEDEIYAETAENFLNLIGSYLPTPIAPLKDVILDLIVKEYNSPKDTYCIYRTETFDRAGKNIADDRPTDCTISFSDGLGAGLMRDYATGSALGIMAKDLDEAYSDKMLCIILPKRALLEHSIPVYIPPIIAMGSVLGNGEFHHPRIKSLRIKGGIRGDFLGYEPDEIPAVYLTKNIKEITRFWRTLELVKSFKHKACGKTIVVEIYFYNRKPDDKETDSSD